MLSSTNSFEKHQCIRLILSIDLPSEVFLIRNWKRFKNDYFSIERENRREFNNQRGGSFPDQTKT